MLAALAHAMPACFHVRSLFFAAYYAGAHGIALVYDVSDPHEASFRNVQHWMENIRRHASADTVKMLIGNKSDVKPRTVSTERGQALADRYGMKFFETSAKTGHNVEKAFNTLAADCVQAMLTKAAGDKSAKVDPAKVKHIKDKKDCSIQ